MSTKPVPLLFTQLKACRPVGVSEVLAVASLPGAEFPPQTAGGTQGQDLSAVARDFLDSLCCLIDLCICPSSKKTVLRLLHSCVVGFIIQMGDFSHLSFLFKRFLEVPVLLPFHE